MALLSVPVESEMEHKQVEVERIETEKYVMYRSSDCETGDEETEEEPDPVIPS